MTPYYSDDGCTIYHGDCAEVMESLSGAFSLGFADPPYNYGVDYGFGPAADSLDDEYYWFWCNGWFKQLRALCDRTIVTPGHGNLGQWLPRKPSGVGCWYKPGGTGSSHLGWCEWEPWLYWGQRLGGSDVIKATLNPTFKSDVGHPCPKPVLLVKRLIVKTKATTLLDPFVGSGTSLVAAKEMGICGVGIEKNEAYCEIAAKRLAQGVLAL